jgi:hypothetical protein
LSSGDRPRPVEVEAIGAADEACAFRLRFSDRTDVLLASGSVTQTWSAFGYQFAGGLALCSHADDGSSSLGWIDGHELESPAWQVRARSAGGLARLGGRWDATGFHWDEGMQGEIECESTMTEPRSPNR